MTMSRKGLFDEGEITNPGQGDKWSKEDIDAALDEYFAGASPRAIGMKYKDSPRAFSRSIIGKLKSNYTKSHEKPGRAERYRPINRKDRSGKRWTPNEVDLLRSHIRKGVPLDATKCILSRPMVEVCGKVVDICVEGRFLPSQVDILQAHQYLYHCTPYRILTDEEYDRMKRKCRSENEIPDWPCRKKVAEYEPTIRELAVHILSRYLLERQEE